MYSSENVFARILRGEIPAQKVYEDDFILAFHDAFPKAKIHVLVIPKGEYLHFDDFTSKAPPEEIAHFFKVTGEIARTLGLSEEGFRLLSNNGSNAYQDVPHFHVHLMGGEKLAPRP